MSKRISILLYTFACVILLINSGCENDLKDIQALSSSVDSADRYKKIKLSYSDSAQLRVLITAPAMESHFMGKTTQEDRFPQGIKVEFFDDKGQPTSQLTAKSAINYKAKELVVVRDSVTLLSTQGDTFSTEELFWSSRDGSIYTEGYFRYVNGEKVITGRKFKSDQGFKEYSFLNFSGMLEANVPE